MRIIDGREIASKILLRLSSDVIHENVPLKMGIIQIGDNAASDLYIEKKKSDAASIGISVDHRRIFETTYAAVSEVIKEFNERRDITGFIIQLPFKVSGGEQSHLFDLISIKKDIDGMNPKSLGMIWNGMVNDFFIPATVLGVLECFKYISIYQDGIYNAEELDSSYVLEQMRSYFLGKHVVIVNDSIIVGKPLAAILNYYGVTVTICNKNTLNLQEITSNADVLVSAIGKGGVIRGEHLKVGASLIDVGIIRNGDSISGDIDEEIIKDKVDFLTPVPNGVGPLTRAMLIYNLLKAHKIQK